MALRLVKEAFGRVKEAEEEFFEEPEDEKREKL